MQTRAIIKHLDVPNHITSRIAPGARNDLSDPFGFQAVKETLRNGIIPAIALSTHTADHAIGAQKLPVMTKTKRGHQIYFLLLMAMHYIVYLCSEVHVSS